MPRVGIPANRTKQTGKSRSVFVSMRAWYYGRVNSFGNSGVQIPLYDPRSVREGRQRFRRDMLPALERANSLYCPTGRYPTRGWILVARGDYNQLDPYSTSLMLHIGDPTAPGNVGVLNNLAVVQAQCVTRGLASDQNALYLVEVTDGRGILDNEWFTAPFIGQFNIRAPAYPQTFHPTSMNSGTTWTWETMLQELWIQAPPQLGPWPGLPFAPAGTPEGFWFAGVPLWPAICDILAHLGLTVACDLTRAAPFTIVSDGADDPAFTAAQTRYATNLEDDQEWLDVGAGRVPAVVRVLFRRRNAVYGTEETTPYRNDDMARQWDMNTLYSHSVSAPAFFTGAVGIHYIWSDFTVRFDQNGDMDAGDRAQADAIAQERVNQYFDRIYSRTSGSMSQTYAGALPFATGSQVDGVMWSMDHRREYSGWMTTIVRGKDPPWLEHRYAPDPR